jgi:CBS domain-containing protein
MTTMKTTVNDVKTTVRDIMTTRVIWVRPDASFKEMAAALRENRVSAFPVVGDDDKVIGVVSEADMLAKAALDGEPGVFDSIVHHRDQDKARGTTAGDLMTSPPVTITPEDTISRAARLMYSSRVKRLPVVSAAGRLAGIISRADVLAVFDRPDGDIRDEITRDVILGEFLCDPAGFTVTVADGVVTVSGRPETREVGHRIVDRSRHVPGVVAVRDRLSYPPAEYSGSVWGPPAHLAD